VLLSTPGHPPQVILVTSSQPNEGKSCTCLNLALTLAQRGGRVVIIDGDLRKPGVASVLGLANAKGLSSILTGAHGLEEALQQLDALPGLWVLPGGLRPPNPADLLSSVSMKEVLAELRGRFDHVVIDSPPVLLVTDATILTPLVDGIMLVVESGVTVRGAIQRTHKILENAGGKVLGVVLNKLDARRNGYYGSYYPSAYGKYYLADEEQSAVKS
jgi:capsular exopolysaccharide synthesis family protein